MILAAILLLCALILGILVCIEAGFRLGKFRLARSPAGAAKSATLETSVFGLMGLLIAFVFYGAGSRFETKRGFIVEEANAIGTAYLRIDLLPPEVQPQVREAFRSYLRSRIEFYQAISDRADTQSALAHSKQLQHEMWKQSVMAVRNVGPSTQTLFLTATNDAIDMTTVRAVALLTHPPFVVWLLLAVSIIASSLLAGDGMAPRGVRDGVFIGVYAAMLAVVMYVIVDYEYPRVGFIRINPVDRVLIETLEDMR